MNQYPHRLRRMIAACSIAATSIVLMSGPASAHAALESSTPSDGARVPQAPAAIDLAFSEKVTVDPGAIRVTNTSGERVDKADARTTTNGTHIGVSLKDLSPGTYVVSWRAVSDDSHPVSGTITFDVGTLPSSKDAALTAAASGPGLGNWPRAGDAVRMVMYICLLIAAGWCIFRITANRAQSIHDPGPGTRIFLVLSTVGIVASGATLIVQAALISGTGWDALSDGHSLGDAAGSGVGWGILLAAEGTAALVVAWKFVAQQWARAVGVVGAAVLCYSFAVVGHSVSSSPKPLYMALVAVHAGAAAVWFGGGVGLVTALRQHHKTPNIEADTDVSDGGDETDLEPDPNTRIASLVASYSAMATGAIVILGIAGITMGWNEVRSWSNMTSTSYGKALIVKVVLVGLAALFGIRNHFVLVPKIRRGVSKLTKTLAVAMAIELVCLTGAAAATGVLVNLVPAKTAAKPAVFSTTVSFGAQRVNIVISPPAVGTGVIHLYVLDTAGRPIASVDDVSLEFALPSAQIGGITRKPSIAGPGHYQLNTLPFTQPGAWLVTVKGFENKFNEIFGAVEVRIA